MVLTRAEMIQHWEDCLIADTRDPCQNTTTDLFQIKYRHYHRNYQDGAFLLAGKVLKFLVLATYIYQWVPRELPSLEPRHAEQLSRSFLL